MYPCAQAITRSVATGHTMDNWAGDFNFTARFNRQAQRCAFSTGLARQFVSFGEACQVRFQADFPSSHSSSCDDNNSNNYQVRGQIVYSRPEDSAHPVERCLTHQLTDSSSASDAGCFPHPDHVLRCEDASAVYEDEGEGPKLHTVVVPLKKSPDEHGTQSAGGQSVWIVGYKFMCLSSCIGTLNGRATKLIFSLESVRTREVVGRFAVDIHICSGCPEHQITVEEESRVPEDASQVYSQLFANSGPDSVQDSDSDGDDDSLYTVEVRGRRNFQVVQYIVDRFIRRSEEISQISRSHSSEEQQAKRFKQDQP